MSAITHPAKLAPVLPFPYRHSDPGFRRAPLYDRECPVKVFYSREGVGKTYRGYRIIFGSTDARFEKYEEVPNSSGSMYTLDPTSRDLSRFRYDLYAAAQSDPAILAFMQEHPLLQPGVGMRLLTHLTPTLADVLWGSPFPYGMRLRSEVLPRRQKRIFLEAQERLMDSTDDGLVSRAFATLNNLLRNPNLLSRGLIHASDRAVDFILQVIRSMPSGMSDPSVSSTLEHAGNILHSIPDPHMLDSISSLLHRISEKADTWPLLHLISHLLSDKVGAGVATMQNITELYSHAKKLAASVGQDSYKEQPVLYLNLAYALHTLGEERACELHRRFSLLHFARYPVYLLEKMYGCATDPSLEKEKPLLFLISCESDHNGAFYSRRSDLERLSAHYRIIAIESGDASVLYDKIMDVTQRYGKMSVLMLWGHGTPETIQLGRHPNLGFVTRQIIERLHDFRTSFSEDAMVVLDACAAGQGEASLKNAISNAWGVRVFGSPIDHSYTRYDTDRKGRLRQVNFLPAVAAAAK